jgi:hypothetical protein
MLEESIPEALLLVITSYLGIEDLMSFELVTRKFRDLPLEGLWETMCHRRWKAWARYRWENLQKSHRHLTLKTWKQRCLWVEKDFARTKLSEEELETRLWYFNFTTEAGGRGADTLRKCYFHGGYLFVPDFPPFPCRLINDGPAQRLHVEHFPPHAVERLLSNGEWVIKNQNVTFVSCHEMDTLTYNERCFMDDVSD